MGWGGVNKNRTWLKICDVLGSNFRKTGRLDDWTIIPDLRVLQEFGRIRTIRGNSLGSPKNYYEMLLRVRRISLFHAPLQWGKIEMGQLEINNMIALLYIYNVKRQSLPQLKICWNMFLDNSFIQEIFISYFQVHYLMCNCNWTNSFTKFMSSTTFTQSLEISEEADISDQGRIWNPWLWPLNYYNGPLFQHFIYEINFLIPCFENKPWKEE